MSEVLNELSSALAGAVETAGPGVVRVEARRRFPGSGIVWSADGVIVTASHIVRRDDNIRVGIGEESVEAELVGRDQATDIAVLKAKSGTYEPARWADADAIKVGHITLALGRPGRTVRATMGMVSAIGGAWQSPGGGRFERYLQADVAMHPGFSGGLLIDSTGGALGMNTSGLLRAATPSIPAADVRRVTEALLAHGAVSRGYLGITPQPARLPEALAEKLGQETGLLVTLAEPDGPAGAAGVLLGDVLTSFDGSAVEGVDDLFAALADSACRAVALGLIRGGELREISVNVGERGQS
jgi:S1-C subfamily serine protease